MSVVVIRFEMSSGGPSKITFVVYTWLTRSTIAAGTRSVRAREQAVRGRFRGTNGAGRGGKTQSNNGVTADLSLNNPYSMRGGDN
jgi:hypothetical protein